MKVLQVELVYKVFFFSTQAIAPSELKAWLNARWREGLVLVAVANDFFIFRGE